MDTTKKTFNTHLAATGQALYCAESKQPLFAPSNGYCFRCKKQIYQELNNKGIWAEKASTELITGCPHCNYSFVD